MITQVKSHKVKNGNVMLGIDDLMEGKKANIFYSDPPWGAGNISYWQTINKRYNGIEPEHIDYNDFLNQIFHLAQRHTSGMVLIEYGIKWEQDLINIGTKHGLIHLGVAQITYRSGSRMLPHQLHFFKTQDYACNVNIQSIIDKITGRTGLKCVIDAAQDFKVENGIVLDPCCGLGMTAELAMHLGMNFYGNELNKKRLDTTIKKISK
jgi:hypothetical protein